MDIKLVLILVTTHIAALLVGWYVRKLIIDMEEYQNSD